MKKLLQSIQRAENLHEVAPGRVEIIVVDDGGSVPLGDPGHILLRNAVQRGASYSRNRGIRKATGKYLIFMDDDIEISEDYFEVLDQVIGEEGPDVICPKVCPRLPTAPNVFFTLLLSSLRKHSFVSSSNMIIRKEILGGTRFDSKLTFGEDIDLLCRLEDRLAKKVYCRRLKITHARVGLVELLRKITNYSQAFARVRSRKEVKAFKPYAETEDAAPGENIYQELPFFTRFKVQLIFAFASLVFLAFNRDYLRRVYVYDRNSFWSKTRFRYYARSW